jgi:glycerol-3-phosphate dehydrogenase
VVLFDKGTCGAQTSSATTKMVHGGLRYLERFHFALVRESLRERAWLLRNAPALVKPLEILLPIYEDSPRSRIVLKAGLTMYDRLAADENIARHASLDVQELLERVPLTRDGLLGGFSYWDAQVDDFALVRAVVASAIRDGATVREHTRVESLRRDGEGWIVRTTPSLPLTSRVGSDPSQLVSSEERFDVVVNAAGPWMNELLRANGIRAPYVLSLVRGSHLVLDRRVSDAGLLLQSTTDRRVFFVLPWKETTLVGTTEVLQRESPDRVHASNEEIEYLIERFNHYLREPMSRADIASTFSGVRPLVGRATNPSAIGRDFRVVREGTMVNVFGGKLTTFMALARKVALRVDNACGETRSARPAIFNSERSEESGEPSRIVDPRAAPVADASRGLN